MFRTNVLVAFFFGNFSGIKESRLATSRKREQCTVSIAHGHNAAVRRKGTLHVFAQLIQIDFEGTQGFGSKAGIFADKAEQQVFGRYAVAAQIASRNTGCLQYRFRFFRKNTVDIGHIFSLSY